MIRLLYKKNWAIVLVLGSISVVIGLLLIAYSIMVVEKGPVPASGDTGMIAGSFALGLGMGYIICSYMINNLEKKIP